MYPGNRKEEDTYMYLLLWWSLIFPSGICYLKSSILKWVYITVKTKNYLWWALNHTLFFSITSALIPAAFWSVAIYFLLYVSNVRSMFPKLDEVRMLCVSSKCASFVLAETWLSFGITNAGISILGYIYCFRLDHNRQGKGVGIYVHNSSSAIYSWWTIININVHSPACIPYFLVVCLISNSFQQRS